MPPPWARNLLAAVLLIAAALLVGYVVGSMRPVGEPGSPASDLAAENSPTP